MITINVNINYMSNNLTGVTALLIARTGSHTGSYDALVVYIFLTAKIALPS